MHTVRSARMLGFLTLTATLLLGTMTAEAQQASASSHATGHVEKRGGVTCAAAPRSPHLSKGEHKKGRRIMHGKTVAGCAGSYRVSRLVIDSFLQQKKKGRWMKVSKAKSTTYTNITNGRKYTGYSPSIECHPGTFRTAARARGEVNGKHLGGRWSASKPLGNPCQK